MLKTDRMRHRHTIASNFFRSASSSVKNGYYEYFSDQPQLPSAAIAVTLYQLRVFGCDFPPDELSRERRPIDHIDFRIQVFTI